MSFITLRHESVLQVNDPSRFDLTQTILGPSDSEFVKLELSMEEGASYVDVTTNKYLDYAYTVSGIKLVTARVTTDEDVYTRAYSVSVLTEAQDNLFSNDMDLVNYEDDILEYVRQGRKTFIDKHRTARDRILGELDEAGIRKNDGSAFSSTDTYSVVEFRDWSLFKTLRIIFESLSNQVDDIYATKATKYLEMEVQAKRRSTLKLDFDGNGTLDDNEKENMFTGKLVRR